MAIQAAERVFPGMKTRSKFELFSVKEEHLTEANSCVKTSKNGIGSGGLTLLPCQEKFCDHKCKSEKLVSSLVLQKQGKEKWTGLLKIK